MEPRLKAFPLGSNSGHAQEAMSEVGKLLVKQQFHFQTSYLTSSLPISDVTSWVCQPVKPMHLDMP